MCDARRPPLVLTYSCLMLVALVVLSVAAKSMLYQLGVPQTNEQENLMGSQLVAEPAVQPASPSVAAFALPFQGNLRPDALVPVVVQPQLITSSVPRSTLPRTSGTGGFFQTLCVQSCCAVAGACDGRRTADRWMEQLFSKELLTQSR